MSKIPEPTPSFLPEQKFLPWITWSLVASILGVFGLQLYWQHTTGEDVLGDTLGFSPQAMTDHRYWTLLTYAWVHATEMFDDPTLFWLHVVSNVLPLFFLGPLLERLLGHGHFFMLYLGGTLSAVLTWYAFNFSSEAGIIGASGAVFALIAAAGVAAPRARVSLLVFFIIPLRMSLGVAATGACAVELVLFVSGWMPSVAHEAHLGGAIFGAAYLGVWRLMQRPRQTPI